LAALWLPEYLAGKSLRKLGYGPSSTVEKTILAAWQRANVVRFAIFESVAGLLSITFIIEKHGLPLLVALFAVTAMWTVLPTESRLTAWVKRQSEN
jgi:hypothetical protein